MNTLSKPPQRGSSAQEREGELLPLPRKVMFASWSVY